MPRGACFFVSTESVDDPEFTIDAGLNFAVVTFGSPVTDKVVVPENPVPP